MQCKPRRVVELSNGRLDIRVRRRMLNEMGRRGFSEEMLQAKKKDEKSSSYSSLVDYVANLTAGPEPTSLPLSFMSLIC